MKKNNILSLIAAAIFLLLVSSCNVADYNLDPNRSITAEPQSILPNVLFQSFKNRYPWQPALATRQITAISDAQDWQNYNFSYGNWDEYNILRDVQKLSETASKSDLFQGYMAIAKILRAHNFFFLLRMYGDVPYSEALKGEDVLSANPFKPKYDSQKEILLGLLNELDEANTILKNNQLVLNGDIIYNGDIKKWRKAANSYKLRILLMLSKKESDSDLQIKERFKQIVGNPAEYPIFTDASDELKVVYLNSANVRNPLYEDLDTRNKRYVGKTLCDIMKQMQDYRLFYYAMPANKAVEEGIPANNFSAYNGIDGTQTLSLINKDAESGNFSRINQDNYTKSPIGKPSLAFSYSELMLAIAEAAARKWIDADPKPYYDKAIESSFNFYNIDQTVLQNYLTGGAKYDASKGLEQICMQRYILFFHQSDFEPFFHYHRTGYPAINCGMGQSKPIVPYKLMYPASELNVNHENLSAAIKNQGFVQDMIINQLWIYK